MAGIALLVENFQKGAKIRKEEFLEITRSIFGQKNAVGLQLTPVGHYSREPAFHDCEATPQILQLFLQGHLEDALENLLVTQLQRLLDRLFRVQGRQTLVFVTAAR